MTSLRVTVRDVHCHGHLEFIFSMLDHIQSKTAGKGGDGVEVGCWRQGGGDKGEGWQHLRNGLLCTDRKACDACDAQV